MATTLIVMAAADLHVAVGVPVKQQLAAQLRRQRAEHGRGRGRQRARDGRLIARHHVVARQQLVELRQQGADLRATAALGKGLGRVEHHYLSLFLSKGRRNTLE